MENKKKKSTGLLLSILGVISLVLITAGVTYAFFSYTKEGETENTISTGTITFIYDETDAQGISIQNAMPMSDDAGKGLTADDQTFDFQVRSTISRNGTVIPYVVTANKMTGSTLSDSQVKLYLAPTSAADATVFNAGTNYTIDNNVVKTYAQLQTIGATGDNNAVTQNMTAATMDEKIIYAGQASGSNYVNNFTLRMWLNGDTANSGVDYSPYEFVATSAVSGTYLAISDLTLDTNFIKSAGATGYYSKNDTDRANFERIVFVSADGDYVITRSQALAANLVTVPTGATTGYEYVNYQCVDTNGDTVTAADKAACVATTGNEWVAAPTTIEINGTNVVFNPTEQYYPINGQEFKVKVNVYANATVQNIGSTTSGS